MVWLKIWSNIWHHYSAKITIHYIPSKMNNIINNCLPQGVQGAEPPPPPSNLPDFP